MPSSHQTVKLSAGRHRSPDEGVCVMELASMLAGEPFSDHPLSVSPTLASVLRGYNDGLDDERRQSLKRFAAAGVGTAGPRRAEQERRRIVRMWLADRADVHGLRAAVCRVLDAADPYTAVRGVGRRVAIAGDDRLHARMLALIDSLVALTARPAPVLSVPQEEEPERAEEVAPAG